MSNWDYDSIQKGIAEKYKNKNLTQKELFNRVIELESQLHPFYIALSPITEYSWRGTHCTSKLYPLRDDSETKFYVFNKQTKKMDLVGIPEKDLSKTDYCLEDSLTINDGSNLEDNFEIIAFHQQAPGCYISNGNITVGDIRRLIKVITDVRPTVQKDTS